MSAVEHFPLLEGCVLDEPNFDPGASELQHVYCRKQNAIFILSKQLYKKVLSQPATNACEQLPERGLDFGACIQFQSDGAKQITSFKLFNQTMSIGKLDGKNLFRSICVFNKDLDRVSTKEFNTFDVNRNDIMALSDIPTSNISVECFIEWELEGRKLFPKIYKFICVAAEDQEFATQTDWHVNSDGQQREPVRVEKSLITGLTSVFVPDLFSHSVLLPSHNRKFHSIGRFAQCELVYNTVRKSYVAHNLEHMSCPNYSMMLVRKPDNVEGIFYVDLNMDRCVNGLYNHDFFRLIADPFGFLDLARFDDSYDKTDNKSRTFTVPIKDRLSKTNEHQTCQDMDIITRFEVTSAGDERTQIELIQNLKNREARLDGGGIVVNKESGLVCAHQFSGVIFQISGEHDYENGDCIVFKATRIVDMENTRPTFLITNHKRKKLRGTEPFCTFADGKFTLKAKFNAVLNCYEALSMFGYIPCKVPPPPQEPTIDDSEELFERIYEIKAEENTHLPAQTVLFHGEFVREL